MKTEKYTMKGYSFKKWLEGNKDNLKLVFVAVIGIGTFYVSKLDPSMAAVVAGLVTAVGKLVVDAFDYWLKE